MLMHTKVFGRYNGPEEVMYETPNYTEINVIDNYAPTAKAAVSYTHLLEVIGLVNVSGYIGILLQ